jgi:hypothetical protein
MNITAFDCQTVISHGTLPNGVGFIVVMYDGTYEGFKKMPNGLKMDDKIYGKSCHNSDTFEVVYRTDKKVAEIIT